MNKVFLIGNLTADPVSQTFDSGHSNCRFTLAINRRRGNNDQADFISIVTWDALAQNCQKYLAKGRQVAVEGSIQTGSYEKDGQRRYTVDVVAQNVQFLGGGGGAGANQSAPARNNNDTIDSLQEVSVEDDMPF